MRAMNALGNDVSDIITLAKKFNSFYLSGLYQGSCKPFIIAGHQVGLVRPDVMKYLRRFPEVFRITGKFVLLNPAFRDYKERTDKVGEILQKLRSEDVLCTLKGWRNECFAVSVPFHNINLMEMDRSAVCLFGIRNYGVSITGYINHPLKGLCIWLQQRSFTKQTWPGKWDCCVSGGLAVGYGILETVIKEAAEEASIGNDLIKNLKPAGCVSFYFESERGLFPNTEYVYDLELPLEFIPKNADGEVETFELLTVEECLQRVTTPLFKTTSAPVLLDFLVRRGCINPENERDFLSLVELLHVPLQSIYSWPFTAERAMNGDNMQLPNN